MGRYRIRTQDSWEEIECDGFEARDEILWCYVFEGDECTEKAVAIFNSWKYVLHVKEAAM